MCLGGVTAIAQGDCEIEQGIDEMWIDVNGVTELRKRLLNTAFGSQCKAKMVVYIRVIGIERERFLVLCYRIGVQPTSEHIVAKFVVEHDVIDICMRDLLKSL